MIKHVENPFLHIEINDDHQCSITGTGNTWQYLLLFAYIVKVAKEGALLMGLTMKEKKRSSLEF